MSHEKYVSKMPPRISIITPNYNHSKFLEESITSVLNQTHKPDEYIIIDDGSTDQSINIIRQFEKIPFVKVIYNKKNKGSTCNSNKILKIATGDFILFLSADDFLEPILIERYRKFLVQYPDIGFICARSNKVDINSHKIGTYKIPSSIPSGFINPFKARSLLFKYGSYFYGNTVLMNRRKVIEIGGFNPNLLSFVDGIIYITLALKYGFVYVDHVLSNYRRHEEAYSTDTYRNIHKLRKIEKETLKFMRKKPYIFDDSFIKRWKKRWIYIKFNARLLKHKEIPTLAKIALSGGAYVFFRWFDSLNLTILDIKAFLRECRRSRHNVL